MTKPTPKKDALPADKQDKGTSKPHHQTDYNNNEKGLPGNFEWASDYELSEKEANEMADPDWIIHNLIIRGHVVLIPAEPNGGKTTIMFDQAGKMAKKGYDVFYVNTDISGGDAKPMVKQAKANGFKLMLPDMKVSKSMDTVLDKLTKMSLTKDRYDNAVFIFDTLKKMVDVINKSSAKELFKLLRKLSAMGMTIILLAHTNKYKDDDGMPIYEGTGDLRADVDELIYLISQRHDDGSMTVTTKPDKMRGTFEPISFRIDKGLAVTQLDESVDTFKANALLSEKEKDEEVINAINNALSNGAQTQKDIIKYCDDNDCIGERKVKKALKKYAISSDHSTPGSDPENKIWMKTPGGKNSHVFTTIKAS